VMHSRSNPEVRSRRLSSRYWSFGFALGLHLSLLPSPSLARNQSSSLHTVGIWPQVTTVSVPYRVSKVTLNPCP
jgi:hypothetical protein